MWSVAKSGEESLSLCNNLLGWPKVALVISYLLSSYDVPGSVLAGET